MKKIHFLVHFSGKGIFRPKELSFWQISQDVSQLYFERFFLQIAWLKNSIFEESFLLPLIDEGPLKKFIARFFFS